MAATNHNYTAPHLSVPPPRFALIGAGAYIAPRHLQAIRDVGGDLVAAFDPKDGGVGILDKHFINAEFFTLFERFDRYINRLRREGNPPNWLTVCSPSHLHDSHSFFGLRYGMNVICEKPLTVTPWNLDALEELEAESTGRIFALMQLRHHPALLALKQQMDESPRTMHEVELRYITPRGPWFKLSWKGQEDKSGGVITNIGIHFLDALMWIFGSEQETTVCIRNEQRTMGYTILDHARVSWFLSTAHTDLVPGFSGVAERSMRVDGQLVQFSDGFTDLHTRVYEQALAGQGVGIAEARPSIELAWKIRNLPIGSPSTAT